MNSPADKPSVNRQRRSDETLARLSSAAIELIADVGWDNTSTRRVAERAEVSLGVVHYHFDSIDALRRYASLQVAERFFAEVANTALGADQPTGSDAGAGSPAQAIHRVFAVLAGGDPHRPELSVLYQALVAAGRDERLRSELAVMISDYRGAVEQWLAGHGVRDPKQVAFTIVAAIDGFVLQRALDPTIDPALIAEGLARLVESGDSR